MSNNNNNNKTRSDKKGFPLQVATVDLTIEAPTPPEPTTQELMQDLHHELSLRLLAYVRDTPAGKIRASMMSVVRGFLKDQGVTKAFPLMGTREEMLEALDALAGEDMPFH